MIINYLHKIGWFVGLVLLQVLILNNVHIAGYATPFLYIYMDANGVVGIVYKTSPRYSLVIPLLNSKSSISCKIVGSEYFGYLKWEGGDSRFAYLKDLPRHAEFNLGDTVVTSGYSTVFPEGVMVGTVDDMSDSHDGLSYLLKIKLATDFGKVSNVRVISRSGQEEQNMLEKEGEK